MIICRVFFVALCARLTGDASQTEDVVQETLLRDWQHPEVIAIPSDRRGRGCSPRSQHDHRHRRAPTAMSSPTTRRAPERSARRGRTQRGPAADRQTHGQCPRAPGGLDEGRTTGMDHSTNSAQTYRSPEGTVSRDYICRGALRALQNGVTDDSAAIQLVIDSES
jgi:hypothetical protein